MGKRTRIVLYALSLVTMLAMVTLIIFSHGRQSGEPAKDVLSETDISSTEEPVQIPEAEEFGTAYPCAFGCIGIAPMG